VRVRWEVGRTTRTEARKEKRREEKRREDGIDRNKAIGQIETLHFPINSLHDATGLNLDVYVGNPKFRDSC
jgi:hypothetical protein